MRFQKKVSSSCFDSLGQSRTLLKSKLLSDKEKNKTELCNWLHELPEWKRLGLQPSSRSKLSRVIWRISSNLQNYQNSHLWKNLVPFENFSKCCYNLVPTLPPPPPPKKKKIPYNAYFESSQKSSLKKTGRGTQYQWNYKLWSFNLTKPKFFHIFSPKKSQTSHSLKYYHIAAIDQWKIVLENRNNQLTCSNCHT